MSYDRFLRYELPFSSREEGVCVVDRLESDLFLFSEKRDGAREVPGNTSREHDEGKGL